MIKNPAGRRTTVQRYRDLLEINRLITGTLDRQAILQVVVERACRMLDGTAAVVLLLHGRDGDDVLQVVAAHGIPSSETLGRQFTLSSDVATSVGGLYSAAGAHSFVGVPMLLRDRMVGVLAVFGRPERRAGPWDEDLLSALADQAAIAIENARLYEQASRADYLQTVLSHIPDPVYVVGNSGQIRYLNRAGADLLDAEPGESAGDRLSTLLSRLEIAGEGASDRGDGQSLIRWAQRGKAYGPAEARLRGTSGEVDRWLLVSDSPLGDASAPPSDVIVALKDITEMKGAAAERERLLAEVQRRERLLSSVMESARDAIICIDSGGRIMAWNKGAEAMLGYTAEEIIGKPLALLLPDSIGGIHHSMLMAAAAGVDMADGRLVEGLIKGTIKRKDGSDQPVEIAATSWQSGPGVFVTGVMRDISVQLREQEERARLSAAVERERTTLSAVVASLSDGLIVLDANARIRYCNAQAGALLGVDVAATIGQPVSAAFEMLESASQLQAILSDEDQTPANVPDGAALEIAAAGPMRRDLAIGRFRVNDESGGNLGTGLVIRDVTAFREVTRLQERERFAMDMHDGVIQSLYGVALGLATHERRLGQAEGDTVEALRRARLRISAAIQDIRNYISDLRLHELGKHGFRQGLEILAEELRVNAAIFATLDIDPELESRLDPDSAFRVLQVAHEATANIIRHAGASAVTLSAHVEGQQLVLRLTDNGRGFDPSNGGLGGHGLQNMVERARLLGGNMSVTSVPDGGTEVVLAAPLAAAKPTEG